MMEVSVSPDDRRFQERWKDIADRVSKEQDSQKLTELTNEPIDALAKKTRTAPARLRRTFHGTSSPATQVLTGFCRIRREAAEQLGFRGPALAHTSSVGTFCA